MQVVDELVGFLNATVDAQSSTLYDSPKTDGETVFDLLLSEWIDGPEE